MGEERVSLDPLFLSELRLSIMSILMSADEVDFTFIKEITNATAGNISVQLDNLEKAGYIKIIKEFVGKRPKTNCSITINGRKAFIDHFEALKTYYNGDEVK